MWIAALFGILPSVLTQQKPKWLIFNSISLGRVDFKPCQDFLLCPSLYLFSWHAVVSDLKFPSFLLTKLPAFSAARTHALSVSGLSCGSNKMDSFSVHACMFSSVHVLCACMHVCVHMYMCVPNNEGCQNI